MSNDTKPPLKWYRDKDGLSYSRARGKHFSLLVRAAQRYGEEEDRGLRDEWFWAMDAYQKGFAPSEDLAKKAAERAVSRPDEIGRLAGEVEGQCDTCAANAERDRKAADYGRLAGENERLTRERDEARETLANVGRHDAYLVQRARADAAEAMHARESAHHAEAANARDDWRNRAAAADARAEALATAMRDVRGVLELCGPTESRYRALRDRGLPEDAAVRAIGHLGYGAIMDAAARLWSESLEQSGGPWSGCHSTGPAMGTVIATLACIDNALATTPPADLTQHPAYRAGVEVSAVRIIDYAANETKAAYLDGYRAGVEAGIEKAAAIVDDEARMSRGIAEDHDALADGAASAMRWRTMATHESMTAARIRRALLDTKEVRDGR